MFSNYTIIAGGNAVHEVLAENAVAAARLYRADHKRRYGKATRAKVRAVLSSKYSARLIKRSARDYAKEVSGRESWGAMVARGGYPSQQNGFGAAILEGAGTGIGLGLAGAAALPLVKRAFPGLVRGKVNPIKFNKLGTASKTLTLKVGLELYGTGYYPMLVKAGDKVQVTIAQGSDKAQIYGFRQGAPYSQFVPFSEAKATFRNWPKDWPTTDERANPAVHPEPSMQRWGRIGEAIGAAGKSSDGLLDSYAGELADYSMAYVSRARAGALRGWRRGRASTGGRMENPATAQRNPVDTADAMYESFHGAPPTGYEEIIEERAYHGHLAELGVLISLKVAPQYGSKKGKLLELDFGKADDILLCSNEAGTQLYFRGGNQEIDPGALGFKGNQITKDLMTLGVLQEITYQTQKGFDNFKTIDYYHQISEVSKDTHPVLIYDTMNHEMQIAGGSYECLPGGITD